MALLSILASKVGQSVQSRTLFQEADKKSKEMVDLLLVDATITRTTNYENEMTMFPVEDGPDITDHIRTKPITMNIDGIISQTPLSIEAQKASLVTSGVAGANKAIGGFKGASALVGAAGGKLGAKLFQSGGDPASQGRNILESCILEKKLLTIVVGNKKLDNMVMTRLSIPEDNQVGRALKFSCSFQQIRVVTGVTVKIDSIAPSAAHTGAKKTNLGAQAVTDASKQQTTSIAKGFINKILGR